MACGGCQPSLERVVVDLDVDAVASPAGGVVLIGTGTSCEDLDLEVDSGGDTLTLSATGTLPQSGEYCERYIDTGGLQPNWFSATHHVDIPEGRYVVRAGNGGEEVTFEYRDSIVATSRLLDERFATLDAAAEELAWQRQATLELADRLASLLEQWERKRCAQNTMRRHLTDCEFGTCQGA